MISRFLIRMTWLLAACVCQFALMFFLAPVLQQKYFNSIVGPLVMGALFVSGISKSIGVLRPIINLQRRRLRFRQPVRTLARHF